MDRLHLSLIIVAVVLAAALSYTYLSYQALREENTRLRTQLGEARKELEAVRSENEALRKRISQLENEKKELEEADRLRARLADALMKPVVVVVNNASKLSASVDAAIGKPGVGGVVYLVKISGLDLLPQGTRVVVILRQANPLLGGTVTFLVDSKGGSLLVDGLYPRKALWSISVSGGDVIVNATIPYEDLTLSRMYVYIGVARRIGSVYVVLPEGTSLTSARVAEDNGCTYLRGRLLYGSSLRGVLELTVTPLGARSTVRVLEKGESVPLNVKLSCGAAGPYLWAMLPLPP